VNEQIQRVLDAHGGAAARGLILRSGVGRATLDHELRRGRLIRLPAGGYLRPWDADLPAMQERAVITELGMPSAISHLSALRRWGLAEAPQDVHVTVPPRRCPRRPGLQVHRAVQFPKVVRLDGVVTVAAADAVVGSWPLLPERERRSPAITAVRTRLIRAVDLLDARQRVPRLAGARDLDSLIRLLADGCESELELWGLTRVFDVDGLRHGKQQFVLEVSGRRYRLDLAYVDEKVAVEMDGEAYHSTREQREADRRRDAALATIGWLTLRFTTRRMHQDVGDCRRETLAVLRSRS
jgi:very-short-patch-repair endonuclease